MAQFNYAKLAERTDKIIRRFGREEETTFLRRRAGSDITDYAVIALEADFSAKERGDGSVVRRDDTRYLISVVGLEITPDERTDSLLLIDDGVEKEYEIVGTPKRTAPGGVNIFWQLHCRER